MLSISVSFFYTMSKFVQTFVPSVKKLLHDAKNDAVWLLSKPLMNNCLHLGNQWLNYSMKGGGSLFPIETATWLDMYTCVSVTGDFLRVYICHTHNTSFFKVPYHKSVKLKEKNDLVLWDAYNSQMISACCSFNILVMLWALTGIHWTVRIPCLTVVDRNRKVPDLYFKVVDPKLQVADLKAEVGEMRSGGIPPI